MLFITRPLKIYTCSDGFFRQCYYVSYRRCLCRHFYIWCLVRLREINRLNGASDECVRAMESLRLGHLNCLADIALSRIFTAVLNATEEGSYQCDYRMLNILAQKNKIFPTLVRLCSPVSDVDAKACEQIFEIVLQDLLSLFAKSEGKIPSWHFAYCFSYWYWR